METPSMVKGFLGLQKQAINNFFDSMTLFQDQAESTNNFWAKQMRVSQNTQESIDQWRAFYKDCRDASRRLIIDGLTHMEKYCDALGPETEPKK
jgi:hypothetical protein